MGWEEDAFCRAVGALRPYLKDLVVSGGWAHRLFRLRPRAIVPPFSPLVTEDADIAAPQRLETSGRERIDQLLTSEGFKEDLSSDYEPPVSRYVLRADGGSFELEFIANLAGSPVRRDGSTKATTLIAGATAQTLRHVDALLVEPWSVTLAPAHGYVVPGGVVDVRIANAASYLFQKMAVIRVRRIDKQARDVLYVFDTFRMFADSLDDLRDHWRKVASHLSGAAAKHLVENRRLFADPTSNLVAAAAYLANESGRPNPPDARLIAAACAQGFARVFDG